MTSAGARSFIPAHRDPNHGRLRRLTTELEGKMSDQNYTAAFLVDQTPEAAFAAINNVRGW